MLYRSIGVLLQKISILVWDLQIKRLSPWSASQNSDMTTGKPQCSGLTKRTCSLTFPIKITPIVFEELGFIYAYIWVIKYKLGSLAFFLTSASILHVSPKYFTLKIMVKEDRFNTLTCISKRPNLSIYLSIPIYCW